MVPFEARVFWEGLSGRDPRSAFWRMMPEKTITMSESCAERDGKSCVVLSNVYAVTRLPLLQTDTLVSSSTKAPAWPLWS